LNSYAQPLSLAGSDPALASIGAMRLLPVSVTAQCAEF
jgi:hypothetical protein